MQIVKYSAIASTALLTVAIGTTIMAGQVTADVKASPAANQKLLQSLQANATPESIQSARDTSNLRCWQYGELLFEETHLNERTLNAKGMMVFEDNGSGQDREIYLINAGSATCLYEKI